MSGKRSRGKASSQTNRTKLQPEETRSDLPDPAANHADNSRAGTKPGVQPLLSGDKCFLRPRIGGRPRA